LTELPDRPIVPALEWAERLPAELALPPRSIKEIWFSTGLKVILETRSEGVIVNEALRFSRRQILQLGSTVAAGSFLAAAVHAGFPPGAQAQSKLSPDAALGELLEGNKRFTSGRLTHHEQDLVILKQNTEEKQEPFAAVLSCADSRVPIELIFDQSIGRIFVTRVAGNVVTPEIIGSLEYGAVVLGTKVILVIGHSNCGAVKATIQGKEVPGQISSLFSHIQPAVDQAGQNLEAATKTNAMLQASLLSKSSTVISGMVKAGTVRVVPAYYDLGSGSVTILQ
jgi:carbonic anhydrase